MQKNRLGQRSEFISNYIGQIVTVVFIFVFLSIFTDTFLTERNLINVPKQIAPNMYISCGLTLILLTGGIDLSVGSIMALAGMVASCRRAVLGLRIGGLCMRHIGRHNKRADHCQHYAASLYRDLLHAECSSRDGVCHHHGRNVAHL